jgi:hypothetical protein
VPEETPEYIDYSELPDNIQGVLKKTLSQEAARKLSDASSKLVDKLLTPALDNPDFQDVPSGANEANPFHVAKQLQERAALAKASKEQRVLKLLRRIHKLRVEALNLYEPLPHINMFHACVAPERILRGSNRGGKTLGGAVEFARAVTGQDPFGKYPAEGGRAFIVGKDGKHNSEVLYRKLFRAGAFRMIRDQTTDMWRAFRPWDAADKAREKEAKLAPPLIPPRMVQEMGWENKKEQVPNVVRLTNGWEIRFFSSLGKPPQGSDVDLVWFDEEIVNPEWYPEISARLIDRHGKFIWSATAQLGGEQLYELCMTAEAQRETENPRVMEVFAHIDNNPFFTDEQRDLFFDKLTEEQRRIRIEGEFAFTSFRVYPEFDMVLHGVDPFQIPHDWTRFMVVDPGRQVCAVLFAAVPPPWDEERSEFVYLYDELYIRKSSADRFAREAFLKTEGCHFHAFIIDRHGSRITESGSGMTVERQYSDALREQKVASSATGSGFIWGGDDVDGGIEAFRRWLLIRPDGQPRLKIMREKLSNFEYEINRYSYQRKGDQLLDKPVQRNNHLMDCARYLALYEPKWYPVPKKSKRKNPIVEIVREKQRKRAKEQGQDYMRLGPGR